MVQRWEVVSQLKALEKAREEEGKTQRLQLLLAIKQEEINEENDEEEKAELVAKRKEIRRELSAHLESIG